MPIQSTYFGVDTPFRCEWCDKPFVASANDRSVRYTRRYCSRTCYYAAPRAPSRPRLTLAERFWSRVVTSEGCWGWIGEINHNGYAILDTRNLAKTTGTVWLAHRLSWFLHLGQLPSHDVLHTCDNPPCTNVVHLCKGDNAANIADKMSKGRQSRGEQRPLAKLTDADVLAIRRRWDAGGVMQKDLAAEYDIGRSVISEILSRKMWKHLPPC